MSVNIAQPTKVDSNAVVSPARLVNTNIDTIRAENSTFIVDFSSDKSMAFTKPKSVIFCGEEISTPSSWTNLYVDIISILYKNYPDIFKSLSSFPNSTRIEFGTKEDKNRMTAPKVVSNDLCVETNFSATDLVKRLKTLLSMCGLPYNALQIVYEKRSDTAKSKYKAGSVSTSNAYESKFCIYLKSVAKLADKTCSSYVSSIRSAERYAVDNNYTFCSLFCEDKDRIVATATELYSDSDFIKYNEQQHYRFSVAINKLLESLDTEIPNKVSASLRDNSKNQSIVPSEINNGIVEVLKQHYEYGFKYDSVREIMRFRQFADEMGIHLPEADETLKDSILSLGTIIDGRIYSKSDNMRQELQSIVDNSFSSGACVIYYESLFEKEHEWMESHVITSPNMLKEYLQTSIKGYSYSKKVMAKGDKRSEKAVVTDEIKRIWGSHPVESVHNICERLPYIPSENIWRVISGNNFFVWVSEGEYLFIDRFYITEDEEEYILKFVDEACEKNGFVPLNDVPLGSIEEENYELTHTSIYKYLRFGHNKPPYLYNFHII